jgi:uncharacterized protein
MSLLIALASGLLFGLGLIVGGMTDPARIKAFLDVTGAWDPSLALVMGGALAVGLVAFARARRQPRAWAGGAIALPASNLIDARLIAGGVLFGIGWGWAGFCPGPAWVAMASGSGTALLFVGAMLVGMLLHDNVWPRRAG